MVFSDIEQKEMVDELITKIRPYLRQDGGDLEVINIEDGLVYVKMLGACINCRSLDLTIKDGVERMLVENVPGIIGVVVV